MAPFHAGELQVQQRAGVRELADRLAGMAQSDISPAAAAFLAERFLLVVGAADGDGRMWCSPLVGPPGFLRATGGEEPGPAALDIAGRPAAGDPLAGVLAAGPVQVGAIALDTSTRRRLRINGVSEPAAGTPGAPVVFGAPGGLRVRVEQAYGNCPKYIQRRDLVALEAVPGEGAGVVVGAELDEAGRALVAAADTFFVATAAGSGAADASHRGGNPGFVRVSADGSELSWRDFPGNALMMTLGNMVENPATGLLFLDWETGTTLQLSGRSRIEWHGTERELRFRVERVRRAEKAVPLRWGPPELSRFNPPVDAA